MSRFWSLFSLVTMEKCIVGFCQKSYGQQGILSWSCFCEAIHIVAWLWFFEQKQHSHRIHRAWPPQLIPKTEKTHERIGIYHNKDLIAGRVQGHNKKNKLGFEPSAYTSVLHQVTFLTHYVYCWCWLFVKMKKYSYTNINLMVKDKVTNNNWHIWARSNNKYRQFIFK